jgi:cytochrome P450
MSTVPQVWELPDLLAARLPFAAQDDPAVIVMGERLHGVCVALGVPSRDWLHMAQWVEGPTAGRAARLGAYVDVLVADRCWRPGEDLISDLIAIEADGDGLTADEIRAIVVVLLLA